MHAVTPMPRKAIGSVIALMLVFSAGCGNNVAPESDRPTLSSTVTDGDVGDYVIDASAQEGSSKWTFKVARAGGPASEDLRFEWNFGDGGIYVGSSQSITFTEPGLHRVTVRAYDKRDKLAFTLTLDVEISLVNAPPVADAGANLTAIPNGSVFLDGSASFDPDNDEITFLWTQIAGNPVNLLNADTPHAGFVAPLVEEDTRLVFKLEISDGQSQTESSVAVDIEADLGVADTRLPQCEYTLTVSNQGDLGSELEGLRPLTASVTAFILNSGSLSGGTYTWTFDGVEEIGKIDTHATTSHSFSKGGIHAIALSLTVGGLTTACVSTRNGITEDYVTVWPVIEGRVEDATGSPLAGVTVAANAGGTTTITDGDGHYKVHVPDRWTGDVFVQHISYEFTQASHSYLGIDRDWDGQNFFSSGSVEGDGTPPDGGCTVDADCDDEVFCNGTESCIDSTCSPGSTPCKAEETCDELKATCNPLPVDCTLDDDCQDPLFCNGEETCVGGTCVASVNPCDAKEKCNESTGFCDPECAVDADCTGGSFCGGQEICVAGECVAGQPAVCDDDVACTVDSCNAGSNACEHLPSDGSCTDGFFCNGAERCDATLGCQPGTNPCGSLACDENTDTCITAGNETIYYVATNGSDSNDGSASAPFATIKKATGLAVAGDKIYIRSGTYTEWDITFANSGAPGSPITVAAHPGEEGTVTIQRGATGKVAGSIFGLVDATGQAPGYGHYIFRGLILRNIANCFWLGSTTARVHDLMLDNIEFYNAETALKTEFMGVQRIVIRNCEAHGCTSDAGAFNFKTNKATLELTGSGSRNIVFLDNLVRDTPHQSSSGLIMQEQCEHSIVIGNTGYNHGQYPYTSKAGGYHLWLNNKAYNSGKGGFYLGGPFKVYGGGEMIKGSPANYILLNNAVIGRRVIGGGSIVNWWRPANLYLYNNTLLSLKEASTGSANAPLASNISFKTLEYNYNTLGVSKNNILYQAYGYPVAFYNFVHNQSDVLPRKLKGDFNLHFAYGSADSSIGYKIFTSLVPGTVVANLNLTLQDWKDWFVDNQPRDQGDQGDPTDHNTRWADPDFKSFDRTVDSVWQDLRLNAGSPAIDKGLAYGSADNDYPQKVEKFLARWNYLADFDVAVFPEKAALLNRIRTAHLKDIDGNPRDADVDIGAYEAQ